MSMPKDVKINHSNSKTEEVLQFLKKYPDQMFSPTVLQQRLNIFPKRSIHSILTNLKKRNKVSSPRKGYWKFNPESKDVVEKGSEIQSSDGPRTDGEDVSIFHADDPHTQGAE